MQLSKTLYVLHLLHITDTFNFIYFMYTELYGATSKNNARILDILQNIGHSK